MRLPKDFDEYVQKGVMRKCSIDKTPAGFFFFWGAKTFYRIYKNPLSLV